MPGSQPVSSSNKSARRVVHRSSAAPKIPTTSTTIAGTNTAITGDFSGGHERTRATDYQLTVTLPGNGGGTVISSPSGINCPSTCSANFAAGTYVELNATPSPNSYFAGWSAGCGPPEVSGCFIKMASNESASATMNIWPINHIIFMAQENRSFDHYFGAMRAYWAANGYPDQSFDGLPQFNPVQGIPPLYGAAPSNPGCDPNAKNGLPFSDCVVDDNSPTVTSFHLVTQCIENPDTWWDPDHYDLNWKNPYIDPLKNPPMDGFVSYLAHYSKEQTGQGGPNGWYYDYEGIRTMGYYDWTDLNYYYFMATNFATSDRFFSPVMTITQPNRHYLVAATSEGEIGSVGSTPNDPELSVLPIFAELQAAGISWKVYVNPTGTPCTPPYQTSCLMTYDDIYLKDFTWGKQNMQYGVNLGTIGPAGTCGSSPCDFENDLANGTLPQVVQIEPASAAGLDEHGSDTDNYAVNIQAGANYVSGIINSVMQSSSWQDSLFMLTFDEMGGLYDHVPQQPAVSPDGIKPMDLRPMDVCYDQTGPTCDFTWTGYRVPLIVVSPYTRKNYVSHTVADETAILKLIETRFGVAPLTERDAAQPILTEFFDFNNPPWLTPPSPPAQIRTGPCYLNALP